MKLELEYFQGKQSEQFAFYRIPKILFNKEFNSLSTDAKLLYGLFLDRMSLSLKNEWFDKDGRIFIIFQVEEMMQFLNMTKPTISKLQKELDEIGLIERKRQGQGKPSLIYVKNFASLNQKSTNSRVNETELQEVKKIYFKDENNRTSRSKNILPQEVNNSNPNNININNTKFNKISIFDKSDIFDKSLISRTREIDNEIEYFGSSKKQEEIAKLIEVGIDVDDPSILSKYYTFHRFTKYLVKKGIIRDFVDLEQIDNLILDSLINNDHNIIRQVVSYTISKQQKQEKIKNPAAYFIKSFRNNLKVLVIPKNENNDIFKEIKKSIC